jgi:hypothetical protein
MVVGFVDQIEETPGQGTDGTAVRHGIVTAQVPLAP